MQNFLTLILKKIAEKNKQKFNSLISDADLKREQKDLQAALEIYKTALNIEVSIEKKHCNKMIVFCEKTIKVNNDKYAIIINEADKLFNQQDWQQAKEKYEAAILLNPNTEYPKQQKNKCQKEIEKSLLNLNSLLSLTGFKKGKPIIEKYFKSLDGNLIADEKQTSILKDFVNRCIQKSNKRWKKASDKDWKLVIKWVGPETAQEWFNEIIKK